MMEQLTTNKLVLLAYKGPFHLSILTVFGNFLRQLNHTQENAINKLYKVFFELTQNVAYYSAERNTLNDLANAGIGSMLLEEHGDCFKLTTTNLIFKDQGPILADYCEEINGMDHGELRQYKSKKRTSINPDKNAAHIGIIQIGILSLNRVEYQILDLNERNSMFTITTKIDKNYNCN